MNHWKKIVILSMLSVSLNGCLGLNKNAGSDEIMPETATEDMAPEGAVDEFADFDAPATGQSATNTEDLNLAQNSEPATELDEFADFESSASTSPSASPQPEATPAPVDEFSEFDTPTQTPTETAQTPPPATSEDEFDFESELQNQAATPPAANDMEFSATEQNEPQAPPVETDPFISPEPPVATLQPETARPVSEVKIKSIQYKANESGGSILIHADGPITFMTRNNPETQQLIVEIPGAELPDRLKRPFNMRDIKGAFGSLDSYQERGSNVARFVVQLRSNAMDPFVTAEGDTLLIAADKTQAQLITNSTVKSNIQALNGDSGAGEIIGNGSGKILTSRTLQEFLASNSKFYGKKIFIETNGMGVREALRFISEEGGVNMVISDGVTGNVSLKLRDIPWDQAFVVILQARGLGYVRQGNLLRVSTLADLRQEEEAAIKLTTDRLKIEPLVVRVFPVNYAKVDDMATKLKDFLTERGKVIGDQRTNAVVVTDIEQNLGRVEQLIRNLDTQPPQVLIEGRIIEATDSFSRQIGVNWSLSGSPYTVGKSGTNDVTLTPRLTVNTGGTLANNLGINIGTFDIFGRLDAALSLAETENKIRILASPRIVTLSNEKAGIVQTIERPYRTATSTPGAGVTESITFKNLQILLDVTPQITSDASVIMDIKVKRDILGEEVPGVGTGIESREANTKVMVRNGQTSVIGGVYQNDTNESANGVPWLKDLPVVGNLFKYRSTSNRRTELMIFLTPRIVAAGSQAALNSDIIEK